ncbi:MAG: hypothetical protein HY650_16140 [Acidobacteria bacterium]|nr:hypothetical protein [Acidobacteriota bacterium]
MKRKSGLRKPRYAAIQSIWILALLFLLTWPEAARSLNSGSAANPAAVAVFMTGAEGAPRGSVLRLEDLSQGRVSEVTTGLANPQVIHCGPDGRLYFTEIYAAGQTLNQIWRINQDGSDRTLVAQWGATELRPDALLFAANGDLYFGTVSNAASQQTQGIWRIPGVVQSTQSFAPPEQVMGGSTFSAVTPGKLGQVSPGAFLITGPFAGDLLVLDNPSTEVGGTAGRIMRAPKPSFSGAVPFLNAPASLLPKRPQGVAIAKNGEVLVTDFSSGTVFRYGVDGAFKKIFTSGIQYQNQLAIAPDDTVYVTNAAFREGGSILNGDLNVYNGQGMRLGTIKPPVLLRGVTVCSTP